MRTQHDPFCVCGVGVLLYKAAMSRSGYVCECLFCSAASFGSMVGCVVFCSACLRCCIAAMMVVLEGVIDIGDVADIPIYSGSDEDEETDIPCASDSNGDEEEGGEEVDSQADDDFVYRGEGSLGGLHGGVEDYGEGDIDLMTEAQIDVCYRQEWLRLEPQLVFDDEAHARAFRNDFATKARAKFSLRGLHRIRTYNHIKQSYA